MQSSVVRSDVSPLSLTSPWLDSLLLDGRSKGRVVSFTLRDLLGKVQRVTSSGSRVTREDVNGNKLLLARHMEALPSDRSHRQAHPSQPVSVEMKSIQIFAEMRHCGLLSRPVPENARLPGYETMRGCRRGARVGSGAQRALG